MLHAALAELDHIAEIIEAILRIGQIQAGARRDRFAPLDLAGLMADVVEVYEPVAQDAGLRIACLPPMSTSLILGDQLLLTQMFANLIENAVRHCGPGTMIELSLDESTDGAIANVSDNGPGIPEVERQRVLEPFARLDKSRTSAGAGLGLSLVAAIAELHNARLVLADNGPGLSVSLHFPRPASA
jgi:signal transduction histidine kinase